MMRSRLFRCNEPKTKCAVRYRRNCLRSEFRYLVYAISQLRFREFCSAQIICRLQWNIFAWTLLLVEFDGYPIFAALCHTLESEFGIGLLLCVHLQKFCLKENHVMKLSALFSCNEPKTKSSVRYRRSCLQTEIRSYLYATWHSAVLKINEVWIFDTLRFREFCSAQIICRFCVWLKLLYCTSCKNICSCEDCMWIRWRTWLN